MYLLADINKIHFLNLCADFRVWGNSSKEQLLMNTDSVNYCCFASVPWFSNSCKRMNRWKLIIIF